MAPAASVGGLTVRLIDGDELIVKLYQHQPMDWTGSDAEVQELNDWKLFRNMVDNSPTVDAVPVVRCKDCKYYKPQKKSAHWEHRANYCNRVVTIKVQPYDFCSYGERKDGDD